MKKLVVFVLFAVFAKVGNAQTFDEWFKQKKTQKKYLIQQIAALKVYKGYVQKGYSIAKEGLTAIGNIKKGDFNLHSDFFSSFKTVNPSIRNYAKVADIIAFQVKVIQTYKTAYTHAQSFSLFSSNEIDYIYKVFTNLITYSTADIDELVKVITANELEMKDDERLKRIDAIHTSIQDKYSFAKSFAEEVKVLAIARTKDKDNIESSRRLYGIKNRS